MGSASRVANPVMASVLRDTLTALIYMMIIIMILLISMVSVAVRNIITIVMEPAPAREDPAMGSVLKDGSIVVVSVAMNRIIISVMVRVP